MESYGIIIRHLRKLRGLTVRKCAIQVGRSVGWLSEIENGCGTARISEREFNRIVDLLEGSGSRGQFKTWVANYANALRASKTFEGAILKFVRTKKGLSLAKASHIVGISLSQLSKVESGRKEVSLELRNQILLGYGYQPESFKNFVRGRAASRIPAKDKLNNLLATMKPEKVELMVQIAQTILEGTECDMIDRTT